MNEFRLPTTPEQWDRIQFEQINPNDLAIEMECRKNLRQTRVAAAASRLLAFERCVAALAKWMEDGMPMTDDDSAEVEARRILKDAK